MNKLLFVSSLLLASGCSISVVMGSEATSDGGSTSGGSTGGNSWLGHDGGACTDDSQCSSGDYCDFSSFETCVWGGDPALPDAGGNLPWGPFGRAVGGMCLPDGSGTQGAPCKTDEDCIEIFACHASATSEVDCTLESPCPGGGVCWILGTPPPPNCPPGFDCLGEAAPHLRSGSYCDCPPLTCGGSTTGGSTSSSGTSTGGTMTGGTTTGGTSSGGSTTGAPPATYVYVETNDPSASNTNAILAYRRSGQTLVPLPGVWSFALGGAGQQDQSDTLGWMDTDQEIVIDHVNQRLYAVNQGSGTIGGFSINPDGSLKSLPGSPYLSGDGPVSLAIAGNLMYVANQALNLLTEPSYVAMSVNSDGSLSPIPGFTPVTTSVGPSPSQVLISPDQAHLFGADFLGVDPIRSFQITSDGGITQAPGDPYAVPGSPSGSLALGLAVHPTQNILYVGFWQFGEIGVFSYDSTGALTYVAEAPLIGTFPGHLCMSSDGTRMYASNTGDASISTIDLTKPLAPVETQHFLLKDSQGMPFIEMGQEQLITSAPYQLTLSPDEKFLFVVSQRVTTNPNDTLSPGNILHILAVAADGTVSEPGADVAIATPLTARAQGIATIALP